MRPTFTFIEVMLATLILAIGVIIIYQSFFVLLDAFSYYRNYLTLFSLIDEKIWLACNDLSRFGILKDINTDGFFELKNLKARWNLSYNLLDEVDNIKLYEIKFLTTTEGKPLTVDRISYAIFKK